MKFEKRLIGEFFEMQKEFDRLFDEFTHGEVTSDTSLWRPPMDIYETVDSFVVKMEIAGIKPDEDLKIHLEGNKLMISGNRHDRTELKKQHYHQAGLHYGHFEQSIVLPSVLAQKVTPTASYENGFLEIHILKEKKAVKEIIVVDVNDKQLTASQEEIADE